MRRPSNALGAVAPLLAAALPLAAVSCAPAPPKKVTEMTVQERSRVRESIERNIRQGIRAPEFGEGKEWLNVSRPLSLKDDLAGRVVLLDFWTFCCINCIHVLPDLAYLEERFADQPFAVVGIHSAKFENERDAANIRQAVMRYGIEHPVVNDGGFDIWQRYGANAWPTLMVVGPDGYILAAMTGEGHREELEKIVTVALEVYGERGKLAPKQLPIALERERVRADALAFPGKIAADVASRRLVVADTGHDRLVVADLDGRLADTIGSGVAGRADGSYAEAQFRDPQGIALAGNLAYVADTGNHAVRRVDLEARAVTTIAGPESGLSSPWDLALDGGTLYVALAGRHQIAAIDLATGVVRTLAGSGREARQDGAAEKAALAQPSGLALVGRRLVFADSESSSLRAVDLDRGVVVTLAGASPIAQDLFSFGDVDGRGMAAKLQHPLGVAAAADGSVIVADSYNHRVKRLDPETGEIVTLAGTGEPGDADGTLRAASFSEPGGLAVVGERILVADTNNHRVRVVDPANGTVTTLPIRGLAAP